MALPNNPPLSEVLKEARQRWVQTKRISQNIRDRAASGPIPASTVLGLLDNLRTDLAYFTAVAATPNIGTYAQEQYGVTYLIGPDFTAFITAIEDTIAWIVAALPKAAPDVNGFEWVLLQRIDVDGNRIDRTFSVAQTAGLRTILDSLIATVA